jgi:PST family polysaccharide transporter
MAGLRQLALRGGIAMAVRQLVGMALSFAGLVALARLIGPTHYGTYVAALAVHSWLALVCQWGGDVFLVRKPDEPTPDDAHLAFGLNLVVGGLVALLALPLGSLAGAWIGIAGIDLAITALLGVMPLQLAAQVPLALLQRRMDYRRLAWAELSGHAALYAVAIPAAWADWGLAAPLAGWWAQQVVTASLAFRFARYRPRLLRRRPEGARPMLVFGLGYSASVWLWHLRLLLNPLVVARLLGPEAAAGVAVAIRLAEALSFMRVVIWRVSLAALGRLGGDHARIARGVAEGMRLEALAIGPPMAAFALLAPWLVPFALGRDWSGAATVFPWLGLAYLVNGVFSLQSSALYALGRNVEVAAFHALHVAMLFIAALLLIPHFGLMGVGLAEACALASYWLLNGSTQRILGGFPVGIALVWAAAFALPLFSGELGAWTWAGPVVVVMLPGTRRALSGWRSQIQSIFSVD